jgi:hypothetical protein
MKMEDNSPVSMSILRFCQWLADTNGSTALHESVFMYPFVESVHVWALTVFVGFAAVLDLRLLCCALRRTPVSEVARRLLPWTFAGFVVMVISGAMLFYAIPVRTFQNIFFRVKVVLLILAGVNAWVFHANIWRRVADWDRDAVTPRSARVAGGLSLLLWACIIFSGRMIAYNWFDCDKQPQPAIVNWAAGCTTGSGK